MNYDLVGIGNALVDIEVKVEDHFIEKLSLTKGGMTLSSLEDQKNILDAVSGKSSKVVSGGSAANTVHGLASLGGKAYYLGRVADDQYGKHYTEDMKECGVGFPGTDAQTSGTGTCVILVTPDSERTMLTHLGISSQLHPDNVDDTIVRGAKAVYIEGYLWTGDDTRESALKLAETARTSGIPVAFTLSDAFIVNTYKEALLDFIRWKVDILFCNEVEALALAETKNPGHAFDTLQGLAETVFMTRGKEGSWAGRSGQPKVEINPFPVTAVDTTGAGDLYAAGALYGMTHGHDLKEAGILGSYCSAQVVTHMGGRMPSHSHTRVDTILTRYAEL